VSSPQPNKWNKKKVARPPALSAVSVKLLVKIDPTKHLVIDVRDEREALRAPLPKTFESAVNVPDPELQRALGPGMWPARFSCPAPDKDTLLVFLANTQREAERAAMAAGTWGYTKCCVLADGLSAVNLGDEEEPSFKWISRDALAVAIAPATDGVDPLVTLLDVRRHDERTLYGSIPTSLHVPVEQFAHALLLTPEDWARTYRFPKPSLHEPLVLQCRSNVRSRWSALVAEHAGYQRVLVYKQGSYGWRLSSTVQAYPSFKPGDVPPEPEQFEVESVNQVAASEELRALGIIN